MDDFIYVSITGLRLRRFRYAPVFWWYAVASMNQARKAPGCLSAEARTINGIHHTRSAWKSREEMQTYLIAGSHLKAMKAFRKIATGKTYGFETKEMPEWRDVHQIWRDKGRIA